MTNNENSVIIIFAKLPVPGKVKTRMAADLGNDFAVTFYKNCAEHIFSEVSQLKKYGIDCYLFYGIDDDVSKIKKWVNKKFIYNPQVEGDLGNKMSSAFQNVFAHGKNKVIIIGTDIPDISKEIILNAFEALEKNDMVISPAHDGGYYLLGMKKYMPELFHDIEWSTEEVFKKTINKAEQLSLKITNADKLIDIDDKYDLIEWLNDSGNGNTKLKLIIKNSL